ncbi:MAG: acyltransferase [Prevotella sp.]|nr:acyltransferase [Prevotella sp.]
MTNDELLSKTISYLRFPLTVGVVFIHFNLAKNGFSMHGVKYGLNNPEWYYYIINFFSEVLPRIGVPLFFLISGFLFFYRKEFNWPIYRNKLRTRATTLILPFFLWNIIAILIKVSHKLPFLSSIFPNVYKTSIVITPERIFNTFFANFTNEGIFVTPTIEDAMTEVSKNPFPIDVPMWYVRDLMIMVILAPIIYWLIKKCEKWFIILLGIVWYFIKPMLFPDGGYPVLFFTSAFFFSCGAYFSINRKNFVNIMRKAKCFPLLYLLLAVVDTFTKKEGYNIYIHEAGILVGVVSAVIVTSYLIEKGRVKVNMTLANCSFFVFSLHTLIMSDIGKVLFTVFHLPDNIYSMLFMYFVVPTITIILCVLIYIFLKRFMPTTCNVLTGGR